MSNPSSDRYTDPEVDYDAMIASIDDENLTPSKSGSASEVKISGRSLKKEKKKERATHYKEEEAEMEIISRKGKALKRTSVADLLRSRREGSVATSGLGEKGSHGTKRGRTSTLSSPQHRDEYADLNTDPSPSTKRSRTTDTTSATSSSTNIHQPSISTSKGLGNFLFEWSPSSKTAPLPTSSTLHAYGIGSSTTTDEAVSSTGAPPGMGGYIQSRVGLSKAKQLKESTKGYKPVDAKEFKNEKEVDKYLLKTLGKEGNPITNSDLYSRTAHVISASTGHQVSNRGAAKFCMPNQTYMQRRNEKLKEQFVAKRGDVVVAANKGGNGSENEGTEANDSEENEDNTAKEKGEVVPGGMGKGRAFEGWIAGGKRPKRIGVADMKSGIFAGCTIYLNGYTGPRTSDLELKRLIAIHGGNVSYHCTSACTHILVATGLSGTKAQKFLDASSSTRKGKRKVVHVDWALDSVVQGKRLSETAYNVITNKAQPTLFSSLDKKPPPPSGVVDDPLAKGIRDRHAGVRNREIVIVDD